MSYFDDYTGGDASDAKSINSSETEQDSDEEEDTNSINETEEVEIDDDDDDVAKGKEGDNDSVDTNAEEEEDEDEEDEEEDEDDINVEQGLEEDMVIEKDAKKKVKKIPTQKKILVELDDDEDDEDPTGEVYLQKFDKEINDNYIVNCHPESAIQNYDEILAMTKVTRDNSGIIIDDLHKTIPYLTKYEKARILGQRAKQINSGASVFVKVPEKVIDGYLIAELELKEKRVPFIIRRPLPNGGSEYWSIKDLENISF